MRFDENPVAAEAMLDRAHREWEKSHPRAPGVHASDMIFCLRKAWYKRRGIASTITTSQEKLLWIAGNGHHAMLEALGGREQTQAVTVPCTRDGVPHEHRFTATLDLEDHDDPLLTFSIPVEIKSTRKKSTSEYPDMYYYVEQVLTYMIIWRKTMCRLAVIFLVGDYKAVRTPVFRVWDITITDQERHAWMQEIARRVHLIEKPDYPAPVERYDWECGYCAYASARGGPCPQDQLAAGRGGDKSGIKRTGFFVLDTPHPLDPEMVTNDPD